MTAQPVEQLGGQPAERRSPTFGCLVWTVVIVVAAILITRNPLALGLRVAGFRLLGETDVYLENNRLAGEGEPVRLDAAEAIEKVRIDLWFLERPRTMTAENIYAERLERGHTPEGNPQYVIEYTEAGLNQYFTYWFTNNWGASDNLRNVWFELKPAALVIHGEVNMQIGWQPVGAVFQLDESLYQFRLAGVDVDGQLYSTPPRGVIADELGRLEAEGNRALRELLFLDPEGDLFITQITLTEDRATIVAE